jgi:hypothetical protein
MPTERIEVQTLYLERQKDSEQFISYAMVLGDPSAKRREVMMSMDCVIGELYDFTLFNNDGEKTPWPGHKLHDKNEAIDLMRQNLLKNTQHLGEVMSRHLGRTLQYEVVDQEKGCCHLTAYIPD